MSCWARCKNFCCCGRCSNSEDSDNGQPSVRYAKENEGFDDVPQSREEARYVPNPVNHRETSSKGGSGTHIARYDYVARKSEDLSFQKGERFIVLNNKTADWWILKSMRTFNEGYGPSNYLELIEKSNTDESYAGVEDQGRLIPSGNMKHSPLTRVHETRTDNVQSAELASARYSIDNKGYEEVPPGGARVYLTPKPTIPRRNPSPDSRDLYIALYGYQARQDGDLSFKKGERVIVIDNTKNPGWWILKSMKTSDEGYGPSNYIAPMGTAEQEEWYAGPITRAESRHRLVQAENINGTFLVRESGTKPGSFSLDVLHVEESSRKVRRYLIDKRADGRLYLNNTAHFAHLIGIVNCYSKKELEKGCKLVQACPAVEAPQPLSIAKDVFKLERRSLSLDEEIGAGAFAEVWKGTWKRATEVAIKTLKEGTMSPKDFLREAEIMKNLRHPNIVALHGVVYEEPIYIVTEYMQHGSLLQYLRKGPGKHTTLSEHLDMAAEVAAGMAHLESKNYVHRDLRAANVLVGKRGICKVADYGLARLIKDEIYIAAKGTKCPIKWTAPEALTHREFTPKSDVWSFGILLTEIVTRGAEPYYNMAPLQVAEQVVEADYRMRKPRNCPDNIYHIMNQCWSEDPDQRPTFSQLKERFENFTDPYVPRRVSEEVQ